MKKIIGFLLLFITIIGCSFWYICPILNNLPHPTGSYCVGYIRLNWYDTHLSQKVNIEFFYPSTRPKNNEAAFPYQPQKMSALAKIKAQNSVLPLWLWKCFVSNVFSYAEPDAHIAHLDEHRFPAILYLPGIGGEDLHNVCCENLASHGYIVCAIIPAGDITVTVENDGTIIPLNPKLKKAMEQNDRTTIYEYRNQAHIHWVQLIESTLKKLSVLNDDKNSQFYHTLDIHNLGIIGHSHGGAVVTDFCQKDKICKAGINMDGWTKTYNSDTKFDTPFMFVLGSIKDMPEIQNFLKNNENQPHFVKFTFPELGHEAFTDYIMLKQPIAALLDIKPLFGGQGAIAAEKNMIVSLFDKYLKGFAVE